MIFSVIVFSLPDIIYWPFASVDVANALIAITSNLNNSTKCSAAKIRGAPSTLHYIVYKIKA